MGRFLATPLSDRMTPGNPRDVDNGGYVDMRRAHMGLDTARGEQQYALTLGVRPGGERASAEHAAKYPGDRRAGCVNHG
jgi:hypothetical protein